MDRTTEPIVKDDAESLLDNGELITALTKQLQYYFSPQNLEKDTYLNTIMQLNSGFVPVSILINFANVNRIIGSFASRMGISDIADVNVADLLRKSALTSPSTLKIVLLDQDGNPLASHGDDNFESLKGGLTFEAFGKCLPEGDDSTGASRGKIDDDAANEEDEMKASSTVILRDVPEIATEIDIRGIFEKSASNKNISSPTISNLQKEVGKCWFVTIDDSTSQHDLVSILLDFRSQKICNEPIKARLKTQSTAAATNVPSAMQDSGFNPYHGKYLAHRNNSYPIYSGDRVGYSYSRKYTTRPYSKLRGGRGSDTMGSGRGGNDSKKNKINEKVTTPPPPLVEEHFPGLETSPKSTITANHGEIEVNESKRAAITTTNGYAAALLKAAPPVPEFPSTEKMPRSKPETPSRRKNDDTKSTTTVCTEDCSADDKSSLSSKPDSETHNPIPSVSWGGGRSFADILKK